MQQKPKKKKPYSKPKSMQIKNLLRTLQVQAQGSSIEEDKAKRLQELETWMSALNHHLLDVAGSLYT